MLEIHGLEKVFPNGVHAVRGVDLRVPPGEIFCLLGANGAGKTTTMMMVLGFIRPTRGTILISGMDVQRHPLESKKHVAFVSENVMLYGSFTALQNIEFFTKLAGKYDVTRDQCRDALRRVGLAEDAFRRRVRGFSKGMRQRLGIAIAMLKDTEVIILDEPTSGLDPKGGADFLELLRELRGAGKAILMSSHDIFRAKIIADRVGIMRRGRILSVIERDEMENVDLEDLYMHYVEAEEDAAAERPAAAP